MQLEEQTTAKHEHRHAVVIFTGEKFFLRNLRRLFVVGAIDEIEHARRVTYRALQTGLIAVLFQQLNRDDFHRDVIGIERDDALGIVHRARVVAQLKARFHQRAVDARALRSFGIFLEEGFEIADERGAIVTGAVDGLLEFFVGCRMRLRVALFRRGFRRSGLLLMRNTRSRRCL